MKLSHYDFEELKIRFPLMSESGVLQEYVAICNSIKEASDSYGSGELSWDDFSSFLDDTLSAQDYLSGYLAGLYLQEHGYDYADDGRWIPCGT